MPSTYFQWRPDLPGAQLTPLLNSNSLKKQANEFQKRNLYAAMIIIIYFAADNTPLPRSAKMFLWVCTTMPYDQGAQFLGKAEDSIFSREEKGQQFQNFLTLTLHSPERENL